MSALSGPGMSVFVVQKLNVMLLEGLLFMQTFKYDKETPISMKYPGRLCSSNCSTHLILCLVVSRLECSDSINVYNVLSFYSA